MDALKIKVPVGVEAEQKKQHEYKLLGTGRKRKGLSLFELDMKTGDILRVKIESQKTYDARRKTAKHKAIINEENLHCWALNAKNAKRKFLRMLNQ